jgi:hypothetical protein
MPVRAHRDDDISFGCGVGPAVPGVAAGGSVRFDGSVRGVAGSPPSLFRLQI